METARGFSQERFNAFVLEHNAVGFFKEPAILKSGRRSHCYVNWRTVVEDVCLSDELTDYLVNFIDTLHIKPESFFGVPEGGTKIGILVAYKWARRAPNYRPGSHVLSMGRGKPKDHGDPKDKFFLGVPRGRTVILEDTTTTGGSLLAAVETLHGAGVSVVGAVALTNRNERRDDGKTVVEALGELSIPYYAMSNLVDILPAVSKKLHPSDEVLAAVKDYFEQYGEKPLRL